LQTPNLLLAFGAGVLSFLSPCCLPIFPSFLSYVTGISVDELTAGTRAARSRILSHSIAFFAGFSTIYVAMGLVASALADLFRTHRFWLPKVGGLWVALMGLTMLGLIRIPFLMKERRIHFASKPEGYLGSALVGLAYAAGWTPCVGPILGAVLGMAATNPGQGVPLLLAYTVGFAIPFIILAYFIGSVRVLSRYAHYVERVGGALMVAMGLLLATGYMEKVSGWLLEVTGFAGF
jgi:cytochrome c-type biogenesis protein